MLKSDQTSAIRVDEFEEDCAFRLLARHVTCPDCGADCTCTGYADGVLIYDCLLCPTAVEDHLHFAPLFAQDAIQSATMRHYEIDCPYCGDCASLVGGSSQQGYFFVCRDRCHSEFARTIRRL
jgi:hypothetical protein